MASNEDKDPLTWDKEQCEYLLELMLEQARTPGMKAGGSLRTKAMKIVETKMSEKYGSLYSLDKIRNKLKKVKEKWVICKTLLSKSGFGYDHVRKCLLVDDDVWSEHVKYHNKYKGFRHAKNWEHYELLCEIFGDSAEIGQVSGSFSHTRGFREESACSPSYAPSSINPDISEGLNRCGRDHRYCRSLLRMQPEIVNLLCRIIRERQLLNDTRHMSIEEQVCMFLYALGTRASNRNTQRTFCRSGETVSKYFNKVLDSVCNLGNEYVYRCNTDTPSKIADDPRFFPFFKDCLGAIDGTHIPAFVPGSEQLRYYNRKGVMTQNVLGVVGFDMRFHYVYVGWEGSASDSRVLQSALDDNIQPLTIPEGKYYLADGGYSLIKGFLTPYPKHRYHLSEFSGPNGNVIRTKEELFNHRHSSLRTTVERVFGILKSRFPILKGQFQYPYPVQVKIVLATCMLHNFIIAHEPNDIEFEDVWDTSHARRYNISQSGSSDLNHQLRAQRGGNKQLRDSITNKMWNHFPNRPQDDVVMED